MKYYYVPMAPTPPSPTFVFRVFGKTEHFTGQIENEDKKGRHKPFSKLSGAEIGGTVPTAFVLMYIGKSNVNQTAYPCRRKEFTQDQKV